MEKSTDDKFYFDYERFNKTTLSTPQIDSFLDRIVKFQIPSFKMIPYVGPYLELTMLVAQVAGVFKLISMKRDNVKTELMVAKEIHAQTISRRHDNEVIN